MLHPQQSEVIREGIERLLAGETLRGIVADLNARGSTAPRGTPWSGTALRQVLLRERNAARRVHKGTVIGRAGWPAIVDDETFDRFVAMMTDPTRRTNSGPQVRHLLSGLAKCGRCGGTLRGAAAHQYGQKRAPRAYFCATCYRLRRKADAVDAVVEKALLGRLSRFDAPEDLFQADDEATSKARARFEVVEARLNIAADQFAEGTITGGQLQRITEKLRPELDAARSEVRRLQVQVSPELAKFTGADARNAWQEATVDQKRAVIDDLLEVTILPSGAGRSFESDQVRIDWKRDRA